MCTSRASSVPAAGIARGCSGAAAGIGREVTSSRRPADSATASMLAAAAPSGATASSEAKASSASAASSTPASAPESTAGVATATIATVANAAIAAAAPTASPPAAASVRWSPESRELDRDTRRSQSASRPASAISGAPSTISTRSVESAARAPAWRRPARRATSRVSAGAQRPASTKTPTITSPATGRMIAATITPTVPETMATRGGIRPRRYRSWSRSASATKRDSRSARPPPGRAPGTRGTSRSKNLTRRSVRVRKARSCDTNRSR